MASRGRGQLWSVGWAGSRCNLTPEHVPTFTERHDALYVVGSLDETLELRGMRYHPIDIETSVIRAHRSIAEW